MKSMREISQQKKRARSSAAKARDAAENRELANATIHSQLLNLATIQQADMICCYVSFRSEVATHSFIRELLSQGKRIAVPFCNNQILELYQIISWQDLQQGSYGILEPKPEVRDLAERRVHLEECQVSLIPGLAFTDQGDRLGYGRGYYDRLLSTSQKTHRIALAFDCQIVPELPTTAHDQKMHVVLTESGICFQELTVE